MKLGGQLGQSLDVNPETLGSGCLGSRCNQDSLPLFLSRLCLQILCPIASTHKSRLHSQWLTPRWSGGRVYRSVNSLSSFWKRVCFRIETGALRFASALLQALQAGGIRSNRGEQVNPTARVALRFQRKPKFVNYPSAGSAGPS